MFTRLCLLTVATFLAALSGCGPARLDSAIQASLDRATNPEANYDVPAVKSERTIVVEAKSSNSEIDIYVVKSSDTDTFAADTYENRGKKALAAKQKTKGDTLEARVPADTEVRVIVMLCDKGEMKKSEISGRITSKK